MTVKHMEVYIVLGRLIGQVRYLREIEKEWGFQHPSAKMARHNADDALRQAEVFIQPSLSQRRPPV